MKGGSKRVTQQTETEFSIVCRAKLDDKDAVEWLWKKYRNLLVGMIGQYWWYHRLPEAEMESEAALVLYHELEVFKPERVRKPPEEWQFKLDLAGGAWHCRNRLKTAAKHKDQEDGISYDEDEAVSGSERMADNATAAFEDEVFENNNHLYYKYNPEQVALRELGESPEEKAEALMEMLTPFQKALLKLRQADMTIEQIAGHMGCGFTRVRKQIVQARELGYAIFDVKAY